MLAVYRKELKLSFISVWTYFFLFLTLLSFGILSSVFNLSLGYASISYPLGFMTLVLALLLPLFVFMGQRERREEKKLLLSLPVSPASVIMGRFLSDVTLLFIPFAVFAVLPFLFSLFGGGDSISSSLVSLLGCFLYALFLLCGIRLLFDLIRRPVIALISSLSFTLAVYLLNSVFLFIPFPESGIFQRLSSLLNPTGLYYSFTYGKLNLYGTVYFITFVLLFLFLQTLSLKASKGELSHPKKRVASSILSVLLLFSVLTSNVLVSLLPEKIAYRDVSGSDLSYVSGTSLDKLHALKEPLTVYLLSKGGLSRADQQILSFLRRYEEESSFLSLEVIDTDQNPDFYRTYTTKAPNDQSLVVVGQKRHYFIDSSDLYYYHNEDLGVIPSDYYNYLISSYVSYLSTSSMKNLDETAVQLGYHLYYSNSTVAYFNGDSILINAILYTSSKSVRKAYIAATEGFSVSTKDTTLEDALNQNKFSTEYLSSLERIPSDCDYLVLLSPKKDLTEKEVLGISSYLEKGGHIFLTTDYANCNFQKLSSLLKEYGLSPVTDGIVCETDESCIISSDTPYYFSAAVDTSVYAKNYEGIYISLLSHPILISSVEGVEADPILSTTQKGALMEPLGKEILEKDSSYTVGAVSKKKNSSVLWLSSHLSVSSTANDLSSGNNLVYVISVMSDLCPQKEETVSVAPILMTASSLTLSDGNLSLWTLIISVILPLLPLCVGIFYTYARKKRL